ncbi:MAG: hypothetical protein BWZ02_01985 [Lentisphaerae bacterium ADurb.BinA184]|nr:MAG: hypothetical protein BWZ02_01985 [Lentisphaerae bacterium ADurb.BinA184]
MREASPETPRSAVRVYRRTRLPMTTIGTMTMGKISARPNRGPISPRVIPAYTMKPSETTISTGARVKSPMVLEMAFSMSRVSCVQRLISPPTSHLP